MLNKTAIQQGTKTTPAILYLSALSLSIDINFWWQSNTFTIVISVGLSVLSPETYEDCPKHHSQRKHKGRSIAWFLCCSLCSSAKCDLANHPLISHMQVLNWQRSVLCIYKRPPIRVKGVGVRLNVGTVCCMTYSTNHVLAMPEMRGIPGLGLVGIIYLLVQ